MDDLISKYDLLIRSISKKFYNVEKEDLYQAGYLGLIKASNNYKEEYGKFSSYAYKYIFGEMYELSIKSRDIKLNKYYLKLYKLIIKARSYLTQKYEREVNNLDISAYLNIDVSEIEYVCMLMEDMFSLDDEYSFINVGEYSINDDVLAIEDSINSLDPLSSSVMNLRLKYDYTQSEVAKLLNTSQVKVSRIEKRSKSKILEYIS